MCMILGRKMKMESGIASNKDWGLEKVYLHSTRQNLWNGFKVENFFDF